MCVEEKQDKIYQKEKEVGKKMREKRRELIKRQRQEAENKREGGRGGQVPKDEMETVIVL